MTSRRSSFALMCAILPQLVVAADRKASVQPQAVSIGAPVLGYILSGGVMIAVEGVSGAAHTRTVPSARETSARVVLPPGQNYEWVERDGQVFVTDVDGGNGRAVLDAWTGADLISFNSDGGAAALYRSDGRAQVITGLPSAPKIAREVAGPVAAAAIAVSDDAKTLLLTSALGVYAAMGNDPWQLVLARPANAIAFVPGGPDALVAVKDHTYLLRGAMTAEFLTGDGARAIATSTDGRLAIFLAISGKEATVVDLQTQTTRRLELGAIMGGLQRGRDNTLLFIPRQGASPWLLDTSSGALSFAPALSETSRGGGAHEH